MNRFFRDAPAWGVSLLINAAMLVAMNLIIFTTVAEQRLATITTVIEKKEEPRELVFEATSVDQVGTDGDLNSSFQQSVAAALTTSVEPQKQIEEAIEETLLPDVVVNQGPLPQMATEQMTEQFVSRGGGTEVQSGGVEGVMDRLTFEISTSLKDNKTMVFWLFDASGSLEDRRKAIVDRFANVYDQLESFGDTEGLYTVAASFGQGFDLLTDEPVTDITELKKSIDEIEVDESGVENVFSATGQLVEKFKKWKRSEGPWNRIVFIVTDERGDDADRYLEQVIDQAKRFRFRCFVVGNAAVFGQELDYVRYEHPDDQSIHYLPIEAGPETAYPQRLDLAFWGGGDIRTGRISSGFGPYALTRLCAETGGMYLVADQGRGRKYDPAVMRSYMPDYRPARMIETEIRQNPAMASLVEAAARDSVRAIQLPRRAFRADNDNTLRQQITEAQKPLALLDYELRGLHQMLEVGQKGRGKLTDPRWQASFDLALGRVLAMRVRAYGYNVMLAAMKSSPKEFEDDESNEWLIRPSEDIASGPQVRKMAEQAHDLLQGVIDKHPATPWAALAAKELAQPFGWAWRESTNEVYAIQSGARGEEARLLFEREQMQRREREPKTPVKLPKL